MLRLTKITLVAYCLVSLTACSSGPSDIEVETAIKARLMDPSDSSAPRVDSAKNLGCVSTGTESVYTCEVEVEMTMPDVGHMKNIGQLKMVKSNDVWTYEENQIISMKPSSTP